MSQLRQRVFTAVPLLGGLLLLLFVAPVWLAIAASTALIILAAWEWSAFVGLRLPAARAGYAGAVGVLMAGCAVLLPGVPALAAVLWLALVWWVASFLWIVRYPTPVPAAIAAAAGLLVLVPAWLAIVAILRIPEQGPALLLFALCIIFAADIGGYFAGHRFGRIKLAPRVSPGKTWEGLIGGILFAALVSAAGGTVLGLPLAFVLPTGVGIAALSVIGDLNESMFKRSVGLKDSGNLIPGHGGVMDRLDSITAALPAFALALSWHGLLPG